MRYRSELSATNKVVRLVWSVVYLLFFRPSPRVAFRWRAFLLRCFGARVAKGVRVYPSVEFFYPKNTILDANCIIGPKVDFYNVAHIHVGANAIVSQYTNLCAATHDYMSDSFELVPLPIRIGSDVWVCLGAFIGPGVVIGASAVVGARSVVTKNVEPGMVVAGNPAKEIKKRFVEESR